MNVMACTQWKILDMYCTGVRRTSIGQHAKPWLAGQFENPEQRMYSCSKAVVLLLNQVSFPHTGTSLSPILQNAAHVMSVIHSSICNQAPYKYSLTVKGRVLGQQTSVPLDSLSDLLPPCGHEIWSWVVLDKHLNPLLVPRKVRTHSIHL